MTTMTVVITIGNVVYPSLNLHKRSVNSQVQRMGAGSGLVKSGECDRGCCPHKGEGDGQRQARQGRARRRQMKKLELAAEAGAGAGVEWWW